MTRLALAIALAASAAAADAPGIRVVDGDTIHVTLPPARGEPAQIVKHRLADLDTPEAGWRALCLAERWLADHATARVRALIAAADRIEFRWTGRVGRYGRPITEVWIDGVSLADTLKAERLAQGWPKNRGWCE